jgi:hypothetical protein
LCRIDPFEPPSLEVVHERPVDQRVHLAGLILQNRADESCRHAVSAELRRDSQRGQLTGAVGMYPNLGHSDELSILLGNHEARPPQPGRIEPGPADHRRDRGLVLLPRRTDLHADPAGYSPSVRRG